MNFSRLKIIIRDLKNQINISDTTLGEIPICTAKAKMQLVNY